MGWIIGLLACLGLLVGFVALCLGWVRLGVRRRRRAHAELAAAGADFHRRREALLRELTAAVAIRQIDETTEQAAPIGAIAVEEPLILRDTTTADLIALAAVQDEPEGPPRGTAVFVWRDGHWRSVGRKLLDSTPQQTLRRYSSCLARAA